jgi:hypothetical protein
MRQEVKIVLIVFGSLIVLVAAGVGAVVLAFSHVAGEAVANAHDPAAMARTAAKIAHFTLPPGYRIRSATDFGISQDVLILPTEPRAFRIKLTTTGSQAASGLALGAAGVGFASKFVGACELRPQSDDQFAVGGENVAFKVIACATPSGQTRMEMGVVKGSTWNVQVIATGYHGDFDEDALRRLLSSFK